MKRSIFLFLGIIFLTFSYTYSQVAPVANFTASRRTVVVGSTVTFTDQSTNTPTSWDWVFEGVTPPTNTTQNPTVTYSSPGTYDVSLTATNSAGSNLATKPNYIRVANTGQLMADFIASATDVTVGTAVTFTDLSVGGANGWSWTFAGTMGDGTSTAQNPTVTYNMTGLHTVKLVVTNGTDNAEWTMTGYIRVRSSGGTPGTELTADFEFDPDEIVAGECFDFFDLSQGNPTSWSWSFPGAATTTSTLQNPRAICYNIPGTYDVVLEIRRDNLQNTKVCTGCVTVLPNPQSPVINFDADFITIPVGGVVNFINTSENGPFDQWAWDFEGGVPLQSNLETPPPISYNTVGTYDVTLRGRKVNGMQGVEFKSEYIKVVPEATKLPTAEFTANYTHIQPGATVNFINLSTDNPHNWRWTFEGGTPSTSTRENPRGIRYNTPGLYKVTLVVSNNIGEDTLEREDYILVAAVDPCTSPPIAEFKSHTRLLKEGEYSYFQNLSEGYPTSINWEFQGATPATSTEGSPSNPIYYNTSGIYRVKLTVSNACGSSEFEKDRYIYVYSGSSGSYCDTLLSVNPGEIYEPKINPVADYGYVAGHSSQKVQWFANYFERYTFNQVRGLIIPVFLTSFDNYESTVEFCIWKPDGDLPSMDAEKTVKVPIRNFIDGQNHIVKFDEPVEIDGPFYAGFKIKYPDVNGDNYSDDMFVGYVVEGRGNNPEDNTMYFMRRIVDGWKSTNEMYNFSTSLIIKPISCLVDIEGIDFSADINVYPNPTTGIVNIQLPENKNTKFNIEVFDALGRKHETKFLNNGYNESTIDISSYPKGIYILRIIYGNSIVNKKILLTK